MAFDGSVRCVCLGSGSAGNAILIESGGAGVLVDAGFSRKELRARLAARGYGEDVVKAVLLTHEHEDHARGAKLFCETVGAPLYATRPVLERLAASGGLPSKCFSFEPGHAFEAAGMGVRPFTVLHDSVGPVGFLVSAGPLRVGLALDLGAVDRLAIGHLRGCDALFLESNHDLDLLRASRRPLRLIRRIAGRNGHLSNDSAAEAMARLLTERTRALTLVHLSGECNRPEIAEGTARRQLNLMRRNDIFLGVASQGEPSEPLLLTA